MLTDFPRFFQLTGVVIQSTAANYTLIYCRVYMVVNIQFLKLI